MSCEKKWLLLYRHSLHLQNIIIIIREQNVSLYTMRFYLVVIRRVFRYCLIPTLPIYYTFFSSSSFSQATHNCTTYYYTLSLSRTHCRERRFSRSTRVPTHLWPITLHTLFPDDETKITCIGIYTSVSACDTHLSIYHNTIYNTSAQTFNFILHAILLYSRDFFLFCKLIIFYLYKKNKYSKIFNIAQKK